MKIEKTKVNKYMKDMEGINKSTKTDRQGKSKKLKRIRRISKILFSIILFLIPINLGKHFLLDFAIVKSVPVDYLIPTIWLTDILIFILLILWVLDRGFVYILRNKTFRLIVIFLVTLLPSIFTGERIYPSIYFYITLMLRVLFMFYVAVEVFCKDNRFGRRNFSKIVKIFSIATFLLSILAIFQWLGQGSVFDNYLFFGEQPYSASTNSIAKVNLFGRLKVPVYGVFRHPNVFGGFLSICLFWIYFEIISHSESYKTYGKGEIIYGSGEERPFYFLILSFFLGFISLVLTFSQVALFAFIMALVFLTLIKRYGKKGVLVCIFATFSIFLSSIFLFEVPDFFNAFTGNSQNTTFQSVSFQNIAPRSKRVGNVVRSVGAKKNTGTINNETFDFRYFINFTANFYKNPSFYRRHNLLKSSYLMVKERPLYNMFFGIGLNNFTLNIPKYLPLSQVLVFNQPVHNVFILIFVESGIFAFLGFTFLFVFCAYRLLKFNYGIAAVFFVTILQLTILGSFDHYLYTINQTQLMLWLTFGLSLAYTNLDEKV